MGVLNGEAHLVLPLDRDVEGVDIDIGVRCPITLSVTKVWLLEVVFELVLVRFGLEGTEVEMDSSGLGGLGSSERVLVRPMVVLLIEAIHGGHGGWRSRPR